MKFYLSSYRIGNETEKLRRMIPKNKKTALIANATDCYNDLKRLEEGRRGDLRDLNKVGLDVEILDLRDYFHRREKLRKKIKEFGVFWVRGGNTFVLRQAMKLSGFDEIILDLYKRNANVLYGGYSAGICVLSPTLKTVEVMDDPKFKPYGKKYKTIWDGLGIVDYAIVPHYKSHHFESKLAGKAVNLLIKNKIPFKALRDGEAIIID